VYKSTNLAPLNILNLLKNSTWKNFFLIHSIWGSLIILLICQFPLPVETVRSLFKHKRVKPYLISNKSQERLSSLSFLSIENTTPQNFKFGKFYNNMFHRGSSSR